jgi:hypothetical protein
MVRLLKSLVILTLLFAQSALAQLDAIELEDFSLDSDNPFQLYNASLNGTPASQNGETVKFVVSLKIKSAEDDSAWNCTGFIVSKDLIMTSGHCLTGKIKPIEINFGVGGYRGFTHTLYSSQYQYIYPNEATESSGGSSSWVNGYLVYNKKAHEEFKREVAERTKWIYYTQDNHNMVDYGLIKINALPDGYGPVEFFKGQVRFRQTAVNLGYGINSRIQSENDGRLRWGLVQFVGFEVDENKYITGFQLFSKDENNQAICMGDSGGPLFVRDGGKLKVVGINTVVMNKCAGAGWITNPRYYRNQLKNMARRLRTTIEI